MINTLHIKNYLLIDEIELDFQNGLTVITGETGAGKSLIIDSLELALGARADSGVVRRGCNKAEIYVRFDADQKDIVDWLYEHDLYEGDEVILQRVIYLDRSSRAYINGRPVTVNLVKNLASRIISVHGQSEHQTLQRTAVQRNILDSFADIVPSTDRLAEIAAAIRSYQSEKNSQAIEKQNLHEQMDLLEHQCNVLVELNPIAGEFSELKQELLKQTHAIELASSLSEISHHLFYGDESPLSRTLANDIRRLEKLADFDTSIKQHSEILYEAQIRIDDVARELDALAQRTELDPNRISTIEDRMAALQQQARIHNVNADDLPDLLETLDANLGTLRTKVTEFESIDEKIELLKSEYQTLALEISKARKEAAIHLSDAVSKNMQYLGMAGGVFTIELVTQKSDEFTGFGNENIRFVVSTTPGQEPGPLATVASGGELSRLSLSIQVVAANTTQIPAIVFDEIDVGIGGKVAERVGELLRTLGKTAQIFCITHLPQVAAKGNQQLNVSKISDTSPSVQIQELDDHQRVMEIARMLSGVKITDRTIDHAREMLSQ